MRTALTIVRLALRIVWALLRVGLAYIEIWVSQAMFYLGMGVGVLVGIWCIAFYVRRDNRADFLQKQGLRRPRYVPESRLW